MNWPAVSLLPAKIIILARSGRGLAQAAHAAGIKPWVIDFYADEDTRAVAETTYRGKALADGRFCHAEILRVIGDWFDRAGRLPLVWGSGLELQQELLTALEPLVDWIGCAPGILSALNDPRTFSAALVRLKIPHPRLHLNYPNPIQGDWLIKRRGGCGGAHIRRWHRGESLREDEYLQAFVPGRPVSLVFAAGGPHTMALGVAEPVTLQKSAHMPFRYGGTITSGIDPVLKAELLKYAAKLSQRYDLKGICGIDCVVEEDGALQLLELNPRPVASAGLFLSPAGIISIHFAASQPQSMRGFSATFKPQTEVSAEAIFYAEAPLLFEDRVDWPPWTSDIPTLGSRIECGEPVCSINAAGTNIATVRRSLVERFATLRKRLAGTTIGFEKSIAH